MKYHANDLNNKNDALDEPENTRNKYPKMIVYSGIILHAIFIVHTIYY